MKDRIVTMFHLSPLETTFLCGYGSLDIPELCTRLGMTVEQALGCREELCRKIGLTHQRLRILGQWMDTGVRPSDSNQVAEWGSCPEYPEGCGEVKPIKFFPLWPVDNRCDLCCEAALERFRKTALRKHAMEVLKETIGAIRGDRIELPRVDSILGKLLELEGGMEQFVKNWHETLIEARKIGSGKKYVLDAYRDIARLLVTVQAEMQPSFDKMDENDLRSYLTDVVLEELSARHKENLLALYGNDEQQLIEDLRGTANA